MTSAPELSDIDSHIIITREDVAVRVSDDLSVCF